MIENAIVLVVVGSIVGSVLVGKELIQGARVRTLIAQQEDIKAGYFAFYDRYRALPGDYSSASTNINCGANPCLDGDGDGRIQASPGNSNNGNHNSNGNGNGNHGNGNNGNGSQSTPVDEGLLAWTHLSAAGFLKANFALTSGTVTAPDESNSPKNPYGAYVQILFDSTWGYSTNPAVHHNLKTGNLIPVAVLAEIDRKVDDGHPSSGSFQSSIYTGSGPAPELGGSDPQSCTTQDGLTASWNEAGGQSNCGAASLL